VVVATANKSGSGKGLRIASGCSTLDEFTAVFRKFCTPNSIFFATRNPRALGDEIKFAVSLKDGKTVMRGTGNVAGSFRTGDNKFKRPGMVIEFKVLDTMGKILLKELNASMANVKPLPAKDVGFDVPTLVHEGDDDEETAAAPDRSTVDDGDDGDEVTRVSPDSMDEDPSMEEYVECTLVEEEAQEADDSFLDHNVDDDDDDDDEDDNEHTTIGPAPTDNPAPTDPAYDNTQVAPQDQLKKVTAPGPAKAKLPGLPSVVRGDPTQQGLGPSGEEETVLAPSHSAVPTPIPRPNTAPPASAVPTPVPPVGPQFSGDLPPPGLPMVPPGTPPPGMPAPGAMSTQMGMPPLLPPPGMSPVGQLPLGQLPLGQSPMGQPPTTDGATTDGATTDGATTDGTTTDGAAADGAAANGPSASADSTWWTV
jgi:hypothetical protein